MILWKNDNEVANIKLKRHMTSVLSGKLAVSIVKNKLNVRQRLETESKGSVNVLNIYKLNKLSVRITLYYYKSVVSTANLL